MPPKFKFTREQIVAAALEVTRKNGITGLTARGLAAELGSSAKPIFGLFQNMEEVQQEVIITAKQKYREYISKGLSQDLAFKGVGMEYILFSINEPKLFQLLFMTEQSQIPDLTGVLPLIDDSYEQILRSIQSGYEIDKSSAEILYRHLWIYTHGIATLCATNMCRFTDEEVSSMIRQVCISILKSIKAGSIDD